MDAAQIQQSLVHYRTRPTAYLKEAYRAARRRNRRRSLRSGETFPLWLLLGFQETMWNLSLCVGRLLVAFSFEFHAHSVLLGRMNDIAL